MKILERILLQDNSSLLGDEELKSLKGLRGGTDDPDPLHGGNGGTCPLNYCKLYCLNSPTNFICYPKWQTCASAADMWCQVNYGGGPFDWGTGPYECGACY